jgi:hypothetical protein
VFNLGDLIKVRYVYHLDYLNEQSGIIVKHYGADYSIDPDGEFFYEVKLSELNRTMILKDSELTLLRKADKNV